MTRTYPIHGSLLTQDELFQLAWQATADGLYGSNIPREELVPKALLHEYPAQSTPRLSLFSDLTRLIREPGEPDNHPLLYWLMAAQFLGPRQSRQQYLVWHKTVGERLSAGVEPVTPTSPPVGGEGTGRAISGRYVPIRPRVLEKGFTCWDAADVEHNTPVSVLLADDAASLDGLAVLAWLRGLLPPDVESSLPSAMDEGVHEDHPFLVVDLLKGELCDRRRRDQTRLVEALTALEDVARLLDALHRAGWVHGGLGPGAVWLDAARRARLMGWRHLSEREQRLTGADVPLTAGALWRPDGFAESPIASIELDLHGLALLVAWCLEPKAFDAGPDLHQIFSRATNDRDLRGLLADATARDGALGRLAARLLRPRGTPLMAAFVTEASRLYRTARARPDAGRTKLDGGMRPLGARPAPRRSGPGVDVPDRPSARSIRVPTFAEPDDAPAPESPPPGGSAASPPRDAGVEVPEAASTASAVELPAVTSGPLGFGASGATEAPRGRPRPRESRIADRATPPPSWGDSDSTVEGLFGHRAPPDIGEASAASAPEDDLATARELYGLSPGPSAPEPDEAASVDPQPVDPLAPPRGARDIRLLVGLAITLVVVGAFFMARPALSPSPPDAEAEVSPTDDRPASPSRPALARMAPGGIEAMVRAMLAPPALRSLWHGPIEPLWVSQGPVERAHLHAVLGPAAATDRPTWADAARFCNGLSRQEGLTPAYDLSGPTPRLIPGASGYRVPSDESWVRSCLLGLAEGSAFEWVDARLPDAGWRAVRGGPAAADRCAWRGRGREALPTSPIGFRVVRPVDGAPHRGAAVNAPARRSE